MTFTYLCVSLGSLFYNPKGISHRNYPLMNKSTRKNAFLWFSPVWDCYKFLQITWQILVSTQLSRHVAKSKDTASSKLNWSDASLNPNCEWNVISRMDPGATMSWSAWITATTGVGREGQIMPGPIYMMTIVFIFHGQVWYIQILNTVHLKMYRHSDLLCFGAGEVYSYSSRLVHSHQNNIMMTPVLVEQP